jgi:hypothetical protein
MIRFLKIAVDLLSVLKTSLGYLGVGQSDDALLTNGASAILEHILCFDFATRYLNLTAIHLQTSTISY